MLLFPPKGYGLFRIYFRFENTDVGKCTVTLCIVEAVAYNKFIGDLDTYLVGSIVHLAAGGLIEERNCFNASCTVER